MTEQTELLAGAVTKLRDTIRPLAHPQPHWDGKARMADPLYLRMREALTVSTSTTGAPMQASKAPARIDVLEWFCDVDKTVSRWIRPGAGTMDKLARLHDYRWTPHHLALVKAITSRCEHWTAHAKDLLGDNPIVIPVGKACPVCEEFWAYTGVGVERTRMFALRVSEQGARCHACRASWSTDQEIGVLLKMLG
jgi:hypothetical protein